MSWLGFQSAVEATSDDICHERSKQDFAPRIPDVKMDLFEILNLEHAFHNLIDLYKDGIGLRILYGCAGGFDCKIFEQQWLKVLFEVRAIVIYCFFGEEEYLDIHVISMANSQGKQILEYVSYTNTSQIEW